MPRKGITGHDEWVITEALATALIALYGAIGGARAQRGF